MKLFVYLPENSSCKIIPGYLNKTSWFNPATGELVNNTIEVQNKFSPPDGWQDAVLIMEL